MAELIPWLTALSLLVGIVVAVYRVYAARKRNKALEHQVELLKREPDVEIVGIRSTGGGGSFVTFTAEIQNVGTKPTRAQVSARVGSAPVRVHPSAADLLVNAPPVGIEVAVARPELGDLMHSASDLTTLYDETLTFTVTAGGKSAEMPWHEEVFDELTDRARWEVQQAAWRRGRGMTTEHDLRMDAIREYEERRDR
jgi:hypothetical protein